MGYKLILPIFSFFVFFAVCWACHYKPVVIVHGLHSTPTTMDFLTNYIRDKHPGTDVFDIKILLEHGDYLPMWYQVFRFNKELEHFIKTRPHGVNLIGFSQGGLIARAMIHTVKNHSVNTFISLGGPQMGYHGEFFKSPGPFDNLGNEEYYSSSISGYYKDPKHLNTYNNEQRFFATLNNDTYNPKSHEFKQNFLKLKKVVAIGGPDDDVMVPWQTTIFGFDDENNVATDYKNQEAYIKDSFGLKTLDERGGFITYNIPGVHHANWHDTPSVLDGYVLPHLDCKNDE